MKERRDLDDAELEKISGAGSSLERDCGSCLPCPPPGGSSRRPEKADLDQEETLVGMDQG
jgi:hypothetical protein